jgi:signal peptidase II
MANGLLKRTSLIFFLVFSTVGCDQVTKFIAKDTLMGSRPLTYLGNMFRLEYMENPGAFLSLGANLSEELRFWIFVVVTGALLIFIALQLIRSQMDWMSTAGLSLMLGGGIGNLIDRIVHGRVIDFMNMGLGSVRTGIFNVADVAIVAGISILILMNRQKQPTRPN